MSSSRSAVTSVIYRSVAAEDFGSVDLDELLAESRVRNRAAGITGMLLHEDGRFVQALEGPDETVRALMVRIGGDPRHERVEVLADEVLPRRRFPDWAMAHGELDDVGSASMLEILDGLTAARASLPATRGRVERIRAWLHG